MVNVLQHVLAFLPNSFGFLMHLGGRDARVPVRAASRRLSAVPTLVCWFCRHVFRLCYRFNAYLTITNAFPAPFRRGQAPVANVTRIHL
ncbi:MAG: hypothetical protein LBQ66_07390 [Planctomycetaceae bacterium]|nr:hypothetical protein [Planctomycetaceae bacterium]